MSSKAGYSGPGTRPPRPYAGLTLVWAAIMLLLTLTPAIDMPRTPAWKLLSFDTAAHAGVFAVLAVLSWFSLRRQRRWLQLARRAGAAVLVGCILFGGLIEVLQYLMNVGRHAEWTDLAGDTLGAALALGVVVPAAILARRRGWALGLLFFLLSWPASAQDMPRARATLVRLASRRLHGRGYVNQGEHEAAAYLRGRLRQLGLQPLAPDFTQPFELDVNTFPGKLKLRLGAHTQLQAGRDFIAAPDAKSGFLRSAPLLPLDSLVFTDSVAARRFIRLPLSQQALLLREKDAVRLAQLPAQLRQHLDSAAAWVTLVPKLIASLADKQAPQPRLELLSTACQPAFDDKLFLQLDAQLLRHYPTQNLCAVVRGTAQPDSFLVVTAHYDHLGMMGRKVYFPGANDNASGVALLLELAGHYTRPENRPACSIAFLLFGAEEAGLVGSSYFVAHPLVPLRQINFLVNLDLLGTGEEGATVVNGRLHEAAFDQLQKLNAAGHYLPNLVARGRAANSDHFPFSETGVPAFFIYTRGGSKAYHDVNDTPDKLSLAGFAGAFRLVRDFLNNRGAVAKHP